MTTPEIFYIPLAVAAVEKVCVACKAGFYRPTGQTVQGIVIGVGETQQLLVHKCPACGDQQNFDSIYPRIDYRSVYDHDWTSETVRETWKKYHKEEN